MRISHNEVLDYYSVMIVCKYMVTSSETDRNLRTLADSLVEVLVRELMAEAAKEEQEPDPEDDDLK